MTIAARTVIKIEEEPVPKDYDLDKLQPTAFVLQNAVKLTMVDGTVYRWPANTVVAEMGASLPVPEGL